MVKAAIDTFVSFSFLPIRAISFLGLIVSGLSFLFGFYVLVNKVFFGTRVDGWTSVMLAVLVLGGVQLVMIGVLGEYLWRDPRRGARASALHRRTHARRLAPLVAVTACGFRTSSSAGRRARARRGCTGCSIAIRTSTWPGRWRPSRSSFSSTASTRRGWRTTRETWFADAAAGQIAGEKSTDYLESAAAAGAHRPRSAARQARVHSRANRWRARIRTTCGRR